MTQAIALRHATARQPASAWFVPGADASVWLEELLGFGIGFGGSEWRRVLVLPLPIPAAIGVLGVLVVAPPGAVPQRTQRAQPYQQRAETVWLPVDTELWPPVEDEELRALAGGRHLVFHPSAGMVAFEPGDVASMVELLAAPVPSAGAVWDKARAGLVVAGGITEVVPEHEPSIEQLFVEERGEIGDRPPSDLPPLPGEPRDRAGLRSLPGPRGWLAKLILRLTRNVPRTADKPTWIDRLEAWSRRHVRRDPAAVDNDQRRREIERLLRLLQDDPAQGLRFALPIGGDEGRGTATPSHRLGERALDFDLQKLGGGGPVDGWDVPAHVQWQLQKRYRDLANAEIAAGRHRRAAYIFAHLLGDLRSAARVLADGRCYREAAVLYRERLQDPESAARCLVDGGLLVDAARLEEELGNWERAGDLRLILGQAEAAEQLYRRQWRRLLENAQWIDAATLRAERLHDVGGALELLSNRASQHGDLHAFAAWLALAERDGRQEQVLRRLRDYGPPSVNPAGLAEVAAAFGARAGPGELRAAARSRVRRLAAAALATAKQLDQRRLLRALRTVSPDDQVLSHDLRRVTRRLLPEPSPQRHQVEGNPSLLRLGQRLTLEGVRWHSAAVTGSALWLAGYGADSGHVPVLRLPWDSETESQHLPDELSRGQRAAQLSPTRRQDAVWLRTAAGSGEQQGLKRIEEAFGKLRVARSSDFGDGCWTSAVDDDATVWSIHPRHGQSGPVLQRLSHNGRLLRTDALPSSLDSADGLPIMVALQGHVVMAFGRTLLLRKPDERIILRELASPVCSLVRSEEGSNPLVLVGMDEGFHVLHVFSEDLDRLPLFGRGLDQPTLGWSRNGVAIAVDGGAVLLARVREQALPDPPLQPYTHGKPWAILPAGHPAEVVFVGQDTITRLEVVR